MSNGTQYYENIPPADIPPHPDKLWVGNCFSKWKTKYLGDDNQLMGSKYWKRHCGAEINWLHLAWQLERWQSGFEEARTFDFERKWFLNIYI